MATTEIPPARLRPPQTDGSELHDVPVLLVQLQDDLARSRLREAFWISIVLHLVLLIAVGTSPRWVRFPKPVPVFTADQLIQGRELTYLDLPRDRQRPPEKPPDSNIISDKNRIASSRRPVLDHRALQHLRDSRPAGAPGPGGQPAPPLPPQPAQPPAMARSTPGPQGEPAAHPTQPQQQAAARPFPRMGMSPGSAINEAARAAVAGRSGGYGGAGGDYGLGASPQSRIHSDLDILSDTMGVDFGPYLSRVLHDVRLNWYNLIPEVARAPLMKKGKVAIEFAILKNGGVAGMKLITPSGDVSLDRAAWGGITGSNPFPPLPGEFRGQYLALRFHFYYNPDRHDLE